MEKATGQSLAFVISSKNVKFLKTDEYALLPTAWMKSASCFSATRNIWRPEISLRGYQIIPRSVDLVYSCNYIPQNVQFYILILLVFVSGESIFCSRVFELLRNLCNQLEINWLNLIVCELSDLYFSVCWCIELCQAEQIFVDIGDSAAYATSMLHIGATYAALNRHGRAVEVRITTPECLFCHVACCRIFGCKMSENT